jgi:heparosan-N-sulfate-glucuronate 5-epimerase
MKLGLYYIDLNKRLGEDFSEYEFDDLGIPLSRFYRQANWQHNPITVCNYGLFHFNNFIRNHSKESKELFFSQADWLTKHCRAGVNESLVWYYLFDLPNYKIKAPWISGMAQGLALSVLLRAHQLSGEKKYLTTAKSAWRIFNIDVASGGVISKFPDGQPLIEEYPSGFFTTGVLNGLIYAIMGVYEYSIYIENADAQKKFKILIDSLKDNLYRFDCGYWSYYDLTLPLRLASKPYHQIHIIQLRELFRITNEKVFKEFADRWHNNFSSQSSNIKWFFRKIHQKVFLRL